MSAVVLVAKGELGYLETGDNDTKYGKWYGLNNQPWCAMFVSWCFSNTGESNKIAAQTKKGFASCDAGLKWFAKHGKLIPIGEAQSGDIVFYQFDTDAQPDHVGIVKGNNKTLKYIYAYEGNTSGNSKGSQSNGGGVYLKKRAYGTIMAIARP